MGCQTVANKWIVLKFGGTSVAGRAQWETIASLAQARQAEGFRVLLVCSAAAGVTNWLSSLAENPLSGDEARELIEIHRSLGLALDVDERYWLAQARQKLARCIGKLSADDMPQNRAELLAIGEWLSTTIGACFLRQQMVVDWVDARDALEVLQEHDLSPARQWLSASCSAGEDPALAGRWAELSEILITQGFVARTKNGATALLGRGGSDTSAALLAGRLAAERLEIWTDVPGLFSADPRLIQRARLLRDVDYAEALEMAASGARVVHSRCIRAAAETGTPVVIRDVHRQSVPGTRISAAVSGAMGIKTVTCQEHMAVILLQNLDARRQVGFLAGVFGVFRSHGVSVDLVATSETTTTVAINRDANHLGAQELEELSEDLRSQCKVRVFADCVCVNLVGHGARTALARLHSVMRYFDEHALLMVSQSANDLCLSLLVAAGEHEPLIEGAHEALIPQGEQAPGSIFGATWEQIQAIIE